MKKLTTLLATVALVAALTLTACGSQAGLACREPAEFDEITMQ